METNDDHLFSENLNRLLENNKKPNGTPYSQKEVVESAPGILTREYLWRLRTGKALKPSYQIVKALADFFGIDPNYFFESNTQQDETAENSQQKDLSHLISLRSSELDIESQKTILVIIDALKKSKLENKKE